MADWCASGTIGLTRSVVKFRNQEFPLDLKEEAILGTAIKDHWYYVSKGRALRTMIGTEPVDEVLDVGAGSGVFTKQLLECGLARRGVCVDPGYESDHVDIHNGRRIAFVRHVDDVPQKLLLMMDVLEHVDDDRGFLRAYTDRMPLGGRVLITVPSFQFLWSGHDEFLEHRRRYTLPGIETIARQANLRVIANERRDWRIHAALAQRLITQARTLYVDEERGLDLTNTVYALDSTTIALCLSVFPWAHFRTTKAAVKMHTLLDLRGNIPSFIHISDGKLHDVHALDMLLPEAGAIYVVDRGYVDFARLYVLHQAGAFFVTRAKSNIDAHRVYSAPTDRSTGIICDQTISLDGFYTRQDYPELLRRIRFKDPESGKTLVFITNNFSLPAATICALYKSRWQVELFLQVDQAASSDQAVLRHVGERGEDGGRYFFGTLFPLVAATRLQDKLMRKFGKIETKSQLRRVPLLLNNALTGIFNVERVTLFRLNRLAGLTAFCLAERV